MSRRAAWWTLNVVLILGIAATAVFAVVNVFESRVQAVVFDPNAADTRDAVVSACDTFATAVFNYTPDDVAGKLSSVDPLMTDSYRATFQQRTREDVVPQAQQRRVTMSTRVVGSAVDELTAESATCLLFLNRMIMEPNKPQVYDSARLVVQLESTDGKWLVDELRPV